MANFTAFPWILYNTKADTTKVSKAVMERSIRNLCVVIFNQMANDSEKINVIVKNRSVVAINDMNTVENTFWLSFSLLKKRKKAVSIP